MNTDGIEPPKDDQLNLDLPEITLTSDKPKKRSRYKKITTPKNTVLNKQKTVKPQSNSGGEVPLETSRHQSNHYEYIQAILFCIIAGLLSMIVLIHFNIITSENFDTWLKPDLSNSAQKKATIVLFYLALLIAFSFLCVINKKINNIYELNKKHYPHLNSLLGNDIQLKNIVTKSLFYTIFIFTLTISLFLIFEIIFLFFEYLYLKYLDLFPLNSTQPEWDTTIKRN